MGRLRFYVKAFLIGACLFAYVALGFTTVLELVGRKPLPDHFIEDFGYYTRAYKDAFKLGDPYAVRDIGTRREAMVSGFISSPDSSSAIIETPGKASYRARQMSA